VRSFACRIAALTALAVLLAHPAFAQDSKEDAPIPPGAKGEVLPLSGQTLELKAVVLPLRGVITPLGGRVDPLQAALKDLGARVQGREIKIDLAADVLFDFDKFDLLPAARPALEKVGAVFKAYPKASATIEGHTDGKGNDQYNQRLSEQRADSVRRWLAANGVTARLTARGFGKTRPIAANAMPNGADNPQGRQKNRRVEITVRTQ
jgi:outer membrane protein OmpA-like peptidoglycan-associated protein